MAIENDLHLRRWARWADWTVGSAAALLLVVGLAGYLYHRSHLAGIAAEHLRLRVVGPGQLQAGVVQRFAIATTSIAGDPVQAQIELALRTPDGQRLTAHQEATDEKGALEISVPGTLKLPDRVRVEVVATHGDTSQRAELWLPVVAPRRVTELALDRPVYRPGEVVRYRSLSLSPHTLAPLEPEELQFEILDPAGVAVAKSQCRATTAHGVACGQFALPEGCREGRYTLLVRQASVAAAGRSDAAAVAQRRTFVVVSRGHDEKPESPPAEPQGGRLCVEFYPEGGGLAPRLENRVYVTVRDPLGRPVAAKGQVVDSAGAAVAAVDAPAGIGAFVFEPAAGQTYRLRLDSPPGTDFQPILPEAAGSQPVALRATPGVAAADKPLECIVQAAEADLPLVVTASCRGATVAQQMLVTRPKANPVSLPLGADASGLVTLTVYDCRAYPPRPVAERLVYRRPARRLNVACRPQQQRYAPGDRASLALEVSDEQGRPVPAVLSLAVVDQRARVGASDPGAGLVSRLLLTPGLDGETAAEAAGALWGPREADAALDSLLATAGWRCFELPRDAGPAAATVRVDRSRRPLDAIVSPAVFDNVEDLLARYRQSLAEYRAARTGTLKALITVDVLGGVALILGLGMLSLLNVPAGLRLWVPGVVVGALGVFFGTSLMDPELLDPSPSIVRFAPSQEVGRGEARAAAAPAAARAVPAATNGKSSPGGGPPGKPAPAQAASKAAPPPGVSAKPAAVAPQIGAYAYRRTEGLREEVPTLYWNPLAVAGADGVAKAEFDLSDAVTEYAILVEAQGEGGRIASAVHKLSAVLPFSLQPLLPGEVTAGDRIEAAVDVVNRSGQRMAVELALEHGTLVQPAGPAQQKVDLPGGASRRCYFQLDAVGPKGECEVAFRARGGRLSDTVRRGLRIVPAGFPRLVSCAGQSNPSREVELALPGDWIPGSLGAWLTAYPAPLASMEHALAGLREKPCGCFEQAASCDLAAAMVLEAIRQPSEQTLTRQQLLKGPEAGLVAYSRGIARGAREVLPLALCKESAQRLAAFEGPGGGFDWFGGRPGDEGLSAYGLLALGGVGRAYGGEAALAQRTRRWLLRPGEPKPAPAAAVSAPLAAPRELVEAYVTWALCRSGQTGIEGRIRSVLENAKRSDDPYVLALAARMAFESGNAPQGREILKRLTGAQAADGHLEGRATMTASGGLSRRVETTALAALAWLCVRESVEQAQRAVDWLHRNRLATGEFGSTQATLLALEALAAHGAVDRWPVMAGNLSVRLDGAVVARRDFPSGCDSPLTLEDLESRLTSGTNRLTVSLRETDDGRAAALSDARYRMPFVLGARYWTRTAEPDPSVPLRLTTRLEQAAVKVGQKYTMAVELGNTAGAPQPMTLAVLGLPAGLEPSPQQLEQLKREGKFDHYETGPRKVVCYWRGLAPQAVIAFKLDLAASIPGKYQGPPSCAYLYYTEERKHWAAPLTVQTGRE